MGIAVSVAVKREAVVFRSITSPRGILAAGTRSRISRLYARFAIVKKAPQGSTTVSIGITPALRPQADSRPFITRKAMESATLTNGLNRFNAP